MLDIHVSLTAQAIGIRPQQVRAVANLLADGATVPFMARYRKEQTGGLDEVQLADIQQNIEKLDALEKRRATILSTIEGQGLLSDALRRQIEQCYDPTILEDLYLPYKPKRKTKATMAREKGLGPLAEQLWLQLTSDDPEKLASAYVNENVASKEEALQGARDIIAEQLSEDAEIRAVVRAFFDREALLRSKVVKARETEAAKFRDYFEFSEALSKIPSHRLLAIRRGEDEGFLRVSIQPDSEPVLYRLEERILKNRSAAAGQVRLALHDAYERLLQPSMETEFATLSKAKADEEAINIFAENLQQLLLSAPLGQRRTLGIDPGFRSGCKVVCLDENGQLLHDAVIYPHPPQSNTREAAQMITHLMEKYDLSAIAVGNGTAGRETVDFLGMVSLPSGTDIYVVNESGASIYSASEVARTEFPNHDVTVRGAVSIGRRLMDPLAELVKIDPKSIGVGQYQHDVNPTRLREKLDRVVVNCVNHVGVNVNTASSHLLTYVSGLGPSLAAYIVKYRSEHGSFKNRKELNKVPRLGDKAFEQCAGFLRIRNGENPLDNTAVHPERYDLVAKMAKEAGCTVTDLILQSEKRKQIDLRKYVSEEVGLPTLQDIMKELEKPGLDPRGQAQAFTFSAVRSMEDLSVGMILPGIVTNLTQFGAFVDIGVKQDGLIHVSQMANRFIKNPMEVLKLNQQVEVRVLEVDLQRKRIHLSLKKES